MKTCIGCGYYLLDTAFHKKQSRCKVCRAAEDKGRIRADPRDPRRNVTPAARKAKRKWQQNHCDPYKDYARRTLRTALDNGLIVRPTKCELCGSAATRQDGITAIHGHHSHGYEKPLDVQWLCPPCHRKAHYDVARKA